MARGLTPRYWEQVAIAEILEAWGEAGFEAHVRDMQREYCQRAATIQVTPSPLSRCWSRAHTCHVAGTPTFCHVASTLLHAGVLEPVNRRGATN